MLSWLLLLVGSLNTPMAAAIDFYGASSVRLLLLSFDAAGNLHAVPINVLMQVSCCC